MKKKIKRAKNIKDEKKRWKRKLGIVTNEQRLKHGLL